jgi:hypothetical protein
MRVVTTKQATIRTASVEIKTLSVSGRQVTLSLFRQFPEEQIIDPSTCQLRGVPWGRVHYFFGGCERRTPKTHLHVVWQKGDELRRACVEREGVGEYESVGWPCWAEANAENRRLSELRLNVYRAAVAFHGLRERPEVLRSGLHGDTCKVGGWEFDDLRESANPSVGSLTCRLWAKRKRLEELRAEAAKGPSEWHRTNGREGEWKKDKQAQWQRVAKEEGETREALADALAVAVRACTAGGLALDPARPESLREAHDALQAKRDALRAGWAARWDELAALDQLYIAV